MTTTKIPPEFLEALTGSEISDGSIGAADIADGAITTAKLAANAINATKLPDNVITATHIPDGLITGSHIANDTVTATQMADNSIGTDQLAGIARGKIIYGDSNGDPQLLAIGSSGTALVSDGTDISWGSTLGATTFSGNVSIGNTNASSFNSNSNNLVVGSGSGGEGITIYSASNNNAQIFFADGTSGDAAYRGVFRYAHDVDRFEFFTAGAIKAVIDSSGNVGIGETSPLATLHIKQGDSGLSSLNAAAHHLFLEDTGANGPGITLASGTTSNCSLVFGDSDSNYQGFILYDNSADAMKFGTNGGTERMRIDSSGRVGINRTPAITNSKLEVGGADNVPLINVEASGSTAGIGIGSGHFQFYTGTTERMRIASGGYVGINTTNPVHALEIKATRANYASTVLNVDTGSGPTNYGYHVNLINDPNDGTRYLFNGQSGNSTKAQIMSNGSYQSFTNSYGSTSDEKLKENIKDASNKLDEVLQLKVRNFNYKADSDKQKLIGMIAQEVETVFPALVFESEDTETVDGEIKSLGTKTKSLKYSVFVPILIKAIQEQQIIIETLKKEVEELKG